MGVQEFLESAIPEYSSAQVIEWRPSLNAYGESCLGLIRETGAFLKRAEASRRTSAAFGRRWLRNFFRNIAFLQSTLLYSTMDMPVVITGSGPSLETVLPQILAVRDSVFILAASSSLPALVGGGIEPDMVISTDGGGWALLHLHEFCRKPKTGGYPFLACSLSAAVPSQCLVEMLPLSDGSLWQGMALNALGIPSALVPQRGTVTASALELAMLISSGNIFFAGMDLSVCDIKSHARPYGFDHLFFGAASRFRPVYSQYFARSGAIKAGGSHDVYADWFRNRLGSLPGRIFSLSGNHAAFNGITGEFPPAGKTSAPGRGNHFKPMTVKGAPSGRCRRVAETLANALHSPQYGATLAGELAPLLFPGESNIPPEKIAETLLGLISV
jgi:hypothetical protein